MLPLYTELSAAAQAAYSELFEAAHSLEIRRSIASLTGSFQSKTIKGKLYWYYAFRDALEGRVRQLYVGPDSPAVTTLRERAQEPSNSALMRGHVRAAIAHGNSTFGGKQFRILRQLADSQFFRAGGLLIGTQAYIALGNMLGVRWESATATLDVDFAHAGPGGNLALALPADMDANVHQAIDALDMGFLPSMTLDGKSSGTYTSATDLGLRLDFLTPSRRSDEPLYAPNLGVCLQPMKFLDYLIEHPVQGVVIANTGAVVVNLPDPARYAMHKLLVAASRPKSERTKALKDITQSAMLMEYLLDHSPDALLDAWAALNARGTKWCQRARASIDQLGHSAPQTHARWKAAVAVSETTD
ncbi:MAG: nucleotidyltransferase domain-containing protein [Xanthomonadales bacterium]|nr:nucleotidyltransferase domain-containing protein [Xanthomonadales bacterium]